MYPTHYKGNPVATQRFTRTLKNKVYRYMTSIFKNIYINKLDYIVNKYNNICNGIVKVKPIDVKPNIYIDFDKGSIKEVYKCKLGDQVGISKYKYSSVKGYVPNCSENFFSD